MKQAIHRKTFATVLLIAGGTVPAAGQGAIQLFLGDPAGIGAIAPFAEGSGQALPPDPELAGVRLLPLDFNGRSSIDELRTDRPRHFGDLGTPGRIRLPGAGGTLYRYERVPASGPHAFGFLLVDAQGATRRLAEENGTGPAQDQDPYASRIAIAPDALAILASTTVSAGGNLLEIELDTGAVLDRTDHLPPLDFLERSLMLADDWAVAVCTRAVLRSGRLSADRASKVPIPGGTPYFSGEVVFSPGATVAMTTAGRSVNEQHAWVFGPQGSAVRATRDAGRFSGAGFLPEALHGPFMAVSDDGSLCAWRAPVGLTSELFMRRTDLPPSLPATQVTADARYTDTLDEIGVLSAVQLSVVFAVGERGVDPGVGIENADFFEARLDATGAPVITNLTLTSGEATPPFLNRPTLTPLALRWIPAAGAFLMHDEDSGGGGSLLSMTPGTTGVQVLLSDVKQVDFVEQVGSEILCSVRRANGSKPHQIVSLPADLSAPPTVVFDSGDASLLQPVAHPTDWIAFVEVPDLGPQSLHRLRIPGHNVKTSALHPTSFGSVLGLTPGLELAFSFDYGGLRLFAVWPFQGGRPYRLLAPATASGEVMPAR